MPCYTDISSTDQKRHYEVLLCKACKFLTVGQIKSLTNPGSGIIDGLDWYSQHLWLDCTHNDDVLAVLSSEAGKSEKAIALKELKRIGFEIMPCGNSGSQLIELQKIDYPY